MKITLKMSTLIINIIFLIFVCQAVAYAESDYKTIDTAQLHSMVVDNAYKIEAGRRKLYMIVDARTQEEYDQAHIFSAVSVPEADFEKLIGILPKDKGEILVVYCNWEASEASRKLAIKAINARYKNIVIYTEGFSTWREKHMPIAMTVRNPQ